MVNYDYLDYLIETTENLILLGHLISKNIMEYQRTKDMQNEEYILKNIKEIIRLTKQQREIYENVKRQFTTK